jgi:hypothetical protein
MTEAGDDRRPAVLSYGLGVDSTAILLRWLELGVADLGPETVPLDDIVVITAMTGDEFADTVNAVTAHVLPRLAAAGVRYVQVARNGPAQGDGITVLADSRHQMPLHAAGSGWPLSAELVRAGSLPQIASGRRLCSQKFKGWPLDTWLSAELAGRPYYHVMGFNADECRRSERDASYSTPARHSRYPLIAWGWGRADCERYLAQLTGVEWPKSCCSYCPFAVDHHLARYRKFPERAAQAMFLERVSLAMNPRMTLFANNSVETLVTADANRAALEQLQTLLDVEHAVYQVRRVYRAKGLAARSVTTLMAGSRAAATAWLTLQSERADGANEVEHGADGQLSRLWLRRRATATYPSAEEFLVVAPHVVADKQRIGFGAQWEAVTNPAPTLFDVAGPAA